MNILIKNVILKGSKKDILIKENEIEKIEDSINALNFEVIDYKGKYAVIPGFVNAHTHLGMTLSRGFADDICFDEWLFNKIIPAEEKLTSKDIYFGTKLGLIEMIKSGTTFVNEMYYLKGVLETVKAIEEMGVRAVVGISVDDSNFESNIKGLIIEYFKYLIDLENGTN